MRVAILPLARPTFDVQFAQSKFRGMVEVLNQTGAETIVASSLVMDDESFAIEFGKIILERPDAWFVLQTTFTDAQSIGQIAKSTDKPIVIWAVREPRTGGRLRLNSLCGLNLAAHALKLRNRDFQWVYSDPESVSSQELLPLIDSQTRQSKAPTVNPVPNDEGKRVAKSLHGARIGKIGAHPNGFDTCNFDADLLFEVLGVEVEEIELGHLFKSARKLDSTCHQDIESPQLSGLADMDPNALRLSCSLAPALKNLAGERNLAAFSIRCWPECFTEYGGAVCAPVSTLADQMLPCACESDVLGAVTQLILQKASGSPVFLFDIVDADFSDDSIVFWHCGQAPMSMRDPGFEAQATVHSNRKLPLLFQFPLKPGVITILRLSKSEEGLILVLAKAEMLRRPLAYSGTAGVVRFDRNASSVIADIIGTGLEHHFALTYGDFRLQLHGVAHALGIKVLEL